MILKIREWIPYLIVLALAVVLLRGGLRLGPQISFPGTSQPPPEPDTLYLQKPPLIVDNWLEKIVYIETEPDTVQIIIYEQTPVTLSFVRATISTSGQAYIEILKNDSVAVVLQGPVEFYGDTHIQVNPDSSVSFLNQRMGWAPAIAAGITPIGIGVQLETFYYNNFLGSNIVLHGPNVGYERSVWGDNVGSDYGTLTVSSDLNPWRSPLRVYAGAKFNFEDIWPPGFTVGISSRLWSF